MHIKLQSVFEDLLKDHLKIGDLWGQKLYVMIVIYCMGTPIERHRSGGSCLLCYCNTKRRV